MDKVITIQLNYGLKKPYDPHTGALTILAFNRAVMGELLGDEKNIHSQTGIIKSFSYDDEEREYKVEMSEDLYFHNGRRATIEDLEFSLLRPFYTDRKIDAQLILHAIEGSDAVESGTAFTSGSVRGVRIAGKNSLIIKLSQHSPDFLYNLAQTTISLVPREELLDDLTSWKRFPIGVGKYQVEKEDIHSVTIKLLESSRGKSEAPEIIQFLLNEKHTEADIVGFYPGNPNPLVYESYESENIFGIFSFFFHYNTEPGASLRFRKALADIVDKPGLVGTGRNFIVADEILPSQLWGRAGHKTDYSEIKAREAGRLLKSEFRVSTLKVPAFSIPDDRIFNATLMQLKQQFSFAGIDLVIEPGNTKYFEEKDAPPARLVTLVTAYTDPLLLLSAFTTGSPNTNMYPPEDSKYSSLLQRAMQQPESAEKVNFTSEVSRYLIENVFCLPLFERRIIYWYNKNKIKSIGSQDSMIFKLDEVKLK